MDMNGRMIAVYKPVGPTSFDMIYKIRKITGIKKVGHAGTLDPLASGVLVVGIGREATKKLGTELKKEKEYVAKICLGMESTTDDAEGEITEFEVSQIPELVDIEKVIPKFEGDIEQIPPIYSALKVKGKRAYKYAREGQELTLGARQVLIKEIEILSYEWPFLELRVVTGPGVYIRSLARDIGKELSVGGYLVGLERTRVGEYSVDEAYTLEQLEAEI